MTWGSLRWGAALAQAANFEENSPKLRCWLCSSNQPEGGGVPEAGRPPVAEDDLVAVGEREELAHAGAHPAHL